METSLPGSPQLAASNPKSGKPREPGSVQEQQRSQQRPGVSVAATHSGSKPGKSPEAAIKSPRDSQKSPAGQLVRNRVEFNPLL